MGLRLQGLMLLRARDCARMSRRLKIDGNSGHLEQEEMKTALRSSSH